MRNYKEELIQRIAFIQQVVRDAKADGIIFGNSGGKDSALTGILCKLACDQTIGIILPCGSACNLQSDREDALCLAGMFDIETRLIDLAPIKAAYLAAMTDRNITAQAAMNLSPRIRMSVLYLIAANEHRLVAGTGNRSEGYMGYFTKWGDGAYDFNPIADLTVQEVYEFLAYLHAPSSILEKAPSAGLYDGQSDEQELGVSYHSIDSYLLGNAIDQHDQLIIEQAHKISRHKRRKPLVYGAKG